MAARHLAIGIAAAAAALVGLTGSTYACGGFFCSQTQPVNQAGEQIIFADNGDGTVTAVVQIFYQGPSSRFAWVLPVPGIPEIGVSSNMAFQRLRGATDPSYILSTIVEGTCRQESMRWSSGGCCFLDAPGSDAAAEAGAPDVTVVASGSVGPYDYEVIAFDPGLADPATAAVDWLATNGYDVTAIGPALLRSYLAEGMNLLAFRLTQDATSGEIRPVTLRYVTNLPMIPIRPTAVAANPNMGVVVWVLGANRAFPTNYRSLILNDAAINWLAPSANYDAVVTRAADESGGQGFVTELADGTSRFVQTIFGTPDWSTWGGIASADWSISHLGLMDQARFAYATWDGFLETVRTFVPLPGGVTAQQFIGCPSCYYSGTIPGFDPRAFVAALYDNVVGPMVRTQALLTSRPYLTRFYTTMSAADMTLDPCFDFNPDLPIVANVHRATRFVECGPAYYFNEAPWRLFLPQGGVIRGMGFNWPAVTSAMPANLRVEQLSTTGQGEVVTDNADEVAATLAAHNLTIPFGTSVVRFSGCGCSSATGAFAGVLPLLGILVLLARRRRTR